MIVFMGLGIATSANADCPDKVDCEYPVATFTQTAGHLNVPTCYKFGHGCRPWHCDGQYKNTTGITGPHSVETHSDDLHRG